MRNLSEDTITQEVLDRIAGTKNERTKEVLSELIQHLHDFARKVRLTEQEWLQGIEFLTAVGHKTDEKRHEFILLSDTLGLSMLTVCINNSKPVGCTEATVFGPFHVPNAPEFALGADIANGAKGSACHVSGRVLGLKGEAIENAHMDVWQADEEGVYDVQNPNFTEHRARGIFRTAPDGSYRFTTVVGESYPIPTDGPVGDMLAATGRHPWRPAHLHFKITAPGYQTLVTHVFREGDKYLDSDAVFGVRENLIAPWTKNADGEFSLKYDFILNRA
jgi:hydroxyquinol 1,2-dioxygenase